MFDLVYYYFYYSNRAFYFYFAGMGRETPKFNIIWRCANTGRRIPSRKIFGQKSLAGTLGFIAVSVVCVSIFLLTFRPHFSLAYICVQSFIAAITGGLAELMSNDKIDDNFSVPLSVAIMLTFVNFIMSGDAIYGQISATESF